MPKLSLKDLEKIREKARATAILKEGGFYKIKITIHLGTCGIAAGAKKIREILVKEIEERNIKNIFLTTSGCAGLCSHEPMVTVEFAGKPPVKYVDLTPEKAQEIFEKHIIGGKPVQEYALAEGGEKIVSSEVGFFKKQLLIALRNRGLINPEKIDDYIARDGYKALVKALTEMTPEEIIQEIKRSGLRGRGGAGFPTGLKWEFMRHTEEEPKYLICNGNEGDRIIEADPHSVLEGILIGAKAIGAKQGFIYIRDEDPLALQTINIAVEQAKEYGLVGDDILGTGFDFNVKVIRGAGAFVCGEETALIALIEGRAGEPRPRPPYPSQNGLWGKPTNINNVETWSNIAAIIHRGAKWFSTIGTEICKGTKVFQAVGKVKDTGLIEIPMGLTLGEIIFDICGGIQKDRKFKAVQIGGPSGGCVSAEFLNLPVDYEQFASVGTIMGSSSMVITDENTCMIDMAYGFLTFTKDESCGKCTPCREGIPRLLEILAKIKEGKGEMEDLPFLEDLATNIKETSLCGLGRTAPNPVLTTLRYFKNEYEDHIKHKKCVAGVCKTLVSSPCHHTCPIGTEASSYIALIAQGKFKEALEVNRWVNPLISVCGRVCHHPCQTKCRAGETGEPIPLRHLKRFVADYEMNNGGRPAVEPRSKKYEKVAVVGSGPAGLMAAWDLAQRAYDVTIFEAERVPGGMLAWGIPEYRLPKNILFSEIDLIKKLGVEIKTKTRIGKDLTLDDLFSRGYKSIFIATGAPVNLSLGIPGEDAEGIIDPIQFLKKFNLEKETKIGKKVAVVGGGNTAIDAARTAWRLGAEVTILYRRTRDEMPANNEEIEAALEEGIRIEFLTLPTEAYAENGKLKKIKCLRMALKDFDKSGRRKPVPLEGSEFEMEIDTLVPAIGQQADLTFLGENTKIKRSKWKSLEVNPETMATNVPGIFAGGDVVSGPATVLEAMRAGKIAAESIHRYLRGEKLAREYKATVPRLAVPPVELTPEETAQLEIMKIPALSIKERRWNFREVELGFTKETAMKEAKRCLRCDLESKGGEK